MAQTGLKDPFSAISHYVGAVAAVLGLVYLWSIVWSHTVAVAAFAIYGVCLIILYVASALYHSVSTSSLWLQRFDHMAIYLMIAGTYTPLCLLAVRGWPGYAMLFAEWAMASVGIAANVFFGGGPKRLRLTLYLLMGWLIVFDLNGVNHVLPLSALLWMLAGGMTFTVGTVIYATGKPKLWPGKFGSHDLWHIFVLGGSICHYFLMLATARLA